MRESYESTGTIWGYKFSIKWEDLKEQSDSLKPFLWGVKTQPKHIYLFNKELACYLSVL